MNARETPADILARLDALAAELAVRGWTTRVKAPRSDFPSLYARNPEPGALALPEHIYARPKPDGAWTYCWPWGQPIAESPDTAAAIIVHVLRPATATPPASQIARQKEHSHDDRA